ncbi:MAG: LemA family protein [Cyclonatronaceae bacterium]
MFWLLAAILVAVLFFFFVWMLMIYTKLSKSYTPYKHAFLRLDAQLKRRYKLIPELVKTATPYLMPQQTLLRQVSQARNQAAISEQETAARPAAPEALERLQNAEHMLSGVLARFCSLLQASAEAQADPKLQQLIAELHDIESETELARKSLNQAGRQYNASLQTFPNRFFARFLGFNQATLFGQESSVQEAKS